MTAPEETDLPGEEDLDAALRAAFDAAGGPSTPGRRLGSYLLEEVIGRGGMGVVYRARQLPLGRRAAVKELAPAASADPRALERFRREAQAAARLDHPGIVRILDVGLAAPGQPAYVAMEWIDGEPLSSLIERRREALGPPDATPTLPPGAVRATVALVEQVARALQYAHEQGVLHRDVKPANVLVGRDGAPRLLDFGLARDESLPSLTETGEVFGTPDYMSPEQLRGQAVDARTDVWSLGVAFYELLTLRRPFEGPRASLPQRIALEEPVRPRRLVRGIPADVETVCLKALEKDRERRYDTAGAFADDLRRILEIEPIRARPSGPWTRAVKWTRRHRTPVTAALAAAAVTLGALALLSPPPPAPAGTVRFLNLASDVALERADSAGGPWEPWPVSSRGEARLPPGPVRLRVRRRNCFPVELPEPVVVRKDAAVELEPRTLPLLRWSQRFDGILAPPVVVRAGRGWKDLVFPGSRVWHQVQGHSGVATRLWSGIGWGRPGKAWPLDPRGSSFLGTEWHVRMDRPEGGSWSHFLDPVAGAPVPDQDRDGVDDIAIVASDGALCLFSGREGRMLWGIPRARDENWNLLACTAGPCAVLVLGDPDGRFRILDPATRSVLREGRIDGAVGVLVPVGPAGPLVLAGPGGAWLLRRVPDGEVARLGGGEVVAGTAADLDGDGAPETVLTGASKAVAWTRNGRLLWSVAVPHAFQVGAGDLDGASGAEVVIAGVDGGVTALSGHGSELWRYEAGARISHAPVMDDLDGDGLGEVAVASADARLHVLAGSPECRKWLVETEWPVGSRPALVRLPGRRPLIIAGTAERGSPPLDRGMLGTAIHAVDAETGAPVWSHTDASAFLWCPDLVDLDGDGVPETLAHTREGKVLAFRATDGVRTCVAEGIGPPDEAPPRLGDVDGDGRPELLFCHGTPPGKTISCWDVAARRERWRTTESWYVWRIEVADLGSDGRTEVICGLDDRRGAGGVLILDGAKGTVERHLVLSGGVNAPPVVADLNGDGAADLVVSPLPFDGVQAFDGRNLDPLWQWKGSRLDSRPAVSDVDGDGRPDLVLSLWDGSVLALRGRDREPLWRTGLSGEGIFSSPEIADLDGDGRPEVVVGLKDCRVAVLDLKTGWLRWTAGLGAEVFGTALCGDLDGDGRAEIVIGANDCRLHAIPGRPRMAGTAAGPVRSPPDR